MGCYIAGLGGGPQTPSNDEPDPAFKDIHAGELAAIRLATTLKADLLLMDDRKGVNLARSKGSRVTGTLGILQLAAMNGLTDLPWLSNAYGKPTFAVRTHCLTPFSDGIQKDCDSKSNQPPRPRRSHELGGEFRSARTYS